MEVKKAEVDEKMASENAKVIVNEETEAENFCHFNCLAATKWGKEYEKLHKNELSAMSERRYVQKMQCSRLCHLY